MLLLWLYPRSVPCFVIIWCFLFDCQCSLNHTVSPFSVSSRASLRLASQCISHSSFHLPFLLFLFYLISSSSLCLLYLFSFCHFSSLALLCIPRPSPSPAHVDTSTVAFEVDPLDLDAEEPPESQGDSRSSKGMSGSVTSPQANIHRLPFFKKVTVGSQDTFVPRLPQHVVRSNLSFPLHVSLTLNWASLPLL